MQFFGGRRTGYSLITFDRLVFVNGRGIRNVQFFGRCRAAYVFITADIRITFDRAGTVDGIVAFGFRIARNSQVLIDCSGIRDV